MNKNKPLPQRFKEHNAAKKLASQTKRVLLTVSGGLDSMVMCHLFSAVRYPFAIAHCNFQLRGEEANGDEALVKTLADAYGVTVLTKRFDTKAYAAEKGLSIQLAARELRYTWFEELRQEHKLDNIATAHHLNDNIETILFNLTKGTGIRGLRGIPVKQGKIIRPMLFASREEIEAYAKEHNIAYREDSSNASDKYTRNKIRHHIIPLLKEINPALEQTFADKIELFTELEGVYEKTLGKEAKQLFLQRRNDIYIPILKLKKVKHAGSALYEYLNEYNFTKEQVEDILASVDGTPGKQFITDKARIIKDRQFFILSKLPEQNITAKLINEGDTELDLGDKKLTIKQGDIKPTADKTIAYLDADKLQFPLIVRRWKQGDYFYPFGMKMKKKKLKKFFVDEKVSLTDKENIWVVESGERIVWVAGYRIDERFKVGAQTKQVYSIAIR